MINTRLITLIYIQKYIHFIICCIWAVGRIFGRHQNASFCYQKDCTVDHIMMYSLVTTSHVQYLVMNDLHYFKTEHKASEHILSVNIPHPIPYTTTPRRCNLVIFSVCRGILLCPLQCSRILRRSFYHRKAIIHIQSGM